MISRLLYLSFHYPGCPLEKDVSGVCTFSRRVKQIGNYYSVNHGLLFCEIVTRSDGEYPGSVWGRMRDEGGQRDIYLTIINAWRLNTRREMMDA